MKDHVLHIEYGSGGDGLTEFTYDAKKIGERLAELRASDGLTREEFAEKLDISKDSVYAYETGKSKMGSEVISRLGILYGESIFYILYGDSANNKVIIPELMINLGDMTIEQQRYMLAIVENIKKINNL